MSIYNDTELFTGPHRFIRGPIGEYILTLARIDPFQAGSQAIGPLEETVTVRGRLVASSDSALNETLNTIREHLTDPPTVAKLIDDHGTEWDDMSFTRFEPTGPTERARDTTLPYEATFIRLA